MCMCFFFFFQAEDGIRDLYVTGVQTCALPISGGTIELVGGVPSAGAGPTLFTGVWTNASVTQIGGSFKIDGGIFSSSTDANLASFFGLSGGPGWSGALNLSFLAPGAPGETFTSSALGSGDAMVSTSVPE